MNIQRGKFRGQLPQVVTRRDIMRWGCASVAPFAIASCGPGLPSTVGAKNGGNTRADQEDWQSYTIGRHRVSAPPGFAPIKPFGTINFNDLYVVKNHSGSANAYLKSISEFGGIASQTTTNGWLVTAIKEKLAPGLIAPDGLVIVGLKKVGNDLIVTKQYVSKRLVGKDGSHPRLRTFHDSVHVAPITSQMPKNAFVFKGYSFSNYPLGYVEDAGVGFYVNDDRAFDLSLYYGPLDKYVPIRKRAETGAVVFAVFAGISVSYGRYDINGYKFEYAKITEMNSSIIGYSVAGAGISGNYQRPELEISYTDHGKPAKVIEDNLKQFLSSIQPI